VKGGAYALPAAKCKQRASGEQIAAAHRASANAFKTTPRCDILGINLTRGKDPIWLYGAMSKTAVAYIRNHRRQLQMLGSGVLVSLLLALGESNERALFAATPASSPTALAAIVDNGPFAEGSLQRQTVTPAAFFARQRNAQGLPGFAPSQSSVPPVVLALAEPGELNPLAELPPGALDGIGFPGTQSRGFQGGPLAGSSPAGAGAAAPVATVPPVPEPATWIMMIVGFFVVGSSLRMRRRSPSVQL